MTGLVCVTGADASGKSTQVARLGATLAGRGTTVVTASIWDALTDPEQHRLLPFGGRSDVQAYLASLGSAARTHFLLHALHVSLDLARRREPELLLVDAYWFKYAATEVAHGLDPAMAESLAAGFPEPDITVYLRLDVDVALGRREEFTDYEGGFDTDTRGFQARAHAALDGFSRGRDWTVLDAARPTGELAAEILTAVLPGGAR